jgi:hypothetical protein
LKNGFRIKRECLNENRLFYQYQRLHREMRGLFYGLRIKIFTCIPRCLLERRVDSGALELKRSRHVASNEKVKTLVCYVEELLRRIMSKFEKKEKASPFCFKKMPLMV